MSAQVSFCRRIDEPARAKAVLHLEPLDGGLGPRTEEAVNRTAFVAESAQRALDPPNALRPDRAPIAGASPQRMGRPATAPGWVRAPRVAVSVRVADGPAVPSGRWEGRGFKPGRRRRIADPGLASTEGAKAP